MYMPTLGSINLLKSKTVSSSFPLGVEESFRRFSLISVTVLFVIGLFVSGAFFYFRLQHDVLVDKRNSFANEIINYSVKEGLNTAIKERLSVTEKIMNAQRPYATLLDSIGIVAAPGKLTSISVDETGRTRISIKSTNIEETLDMINALISLTKQGKIKGPDLTSFQFGKADDILFSVSFVPVL